MEEKKKKLLLELIKEYAEENSEEDIDKMWHKCIKDKMPGYKEIVPEADKKKDGEL